MAVVVIPTYNYLILNQKNLFIFQQNNVYYVNKKENISKFSNKPVPILPFSGLWSMVAVVQMKSSLLSQHKTFNFQNEKKGD